VGEDAGSLVIEVDLVFNPRQIAGAKGLLDQLTAPRFGAASRPISMAHPKVSNVEVGSCPAGDTAPRGPRWAP